MAEFYSSLIKTLSLDPLDPPMIGVMAFLFFLFWKLMMERGVFQPQLEIMNDRISATEGMRAKAVATAREANALVTKYDDRLSEVRAEAFGFKNGEVAVARAEASELIAKAEAEAEVLLKNAREETKAFIERARAAAKGEADSLALNMANTVTQSLKVVQ